MWEKPSLTFAAWSFADNNKMQKADELMQNTKATSLVT